MQLVTWRQGCEHAHAHAHVGRPRSHSVIAGDFQVCAARRQLCKLCRKLLSSAVKTSWLRCMFCRQAGVVWVGATRGVACALIKTLQICSFPWLGWPWAIWETKSDTVSPHEPSLITLDQFRALVPPEMLTGFIVLLVLVALSSCYQCKWLIMRFYLTAQRSSGGENDAHVGIKASEGDSVD